MKSQPISQITADAVRRERATSRKRRMDQTFSYFLLLGTDSLPFGTCARWALQMPRTDGSPRTPETWGTERIGNVPSSHYVVYLVYFILF